MNTKLIKSIAIFMCATAIYSCKKEENTPVVSEPVKTETPKVNLRDTLCRSWMVKSATHNGTTDNSSTGLKFSMKTDGTYILISTGHKGTWEFVEDTTKILLDKNNASIKTTWQIIRLTSKNLDVSFKSPFTGGKATWNAVPF